MFEPNAYEFNEADRRIELSLFYGVHRLAGYPDSFSKGFLRHILFRSGGFDFQVARDWNHLPLSED